MLPFILTNIILFSVGIILFLMVRALPRLSDEGSDRRQTLVERIVMSDLPHRFDVAMNTFLGKFFRKLKVNLMRLDNYLTEKLKTMNTENSGLTVTPTEFIEELSGPLEKAVEKEDNVDAPKPFGNGKAKNGKKTS